MDLSACRGQLLGGIPTLWFRALSRSCSGAEPLLGWHPGGTWTERSSSSGGGWRSTAASMGLCGPCIAGDHDACHCLGLAYPPRNPPLAPSYTCDQQVRLQGQPHLWRPISVRSGNTLLSISLARYKLQASGLPLVPFWWAWQRKRLPFPVGF